MKCKTCTKAIDPITADQLTSMMIQMEEGGITWEDMIILFQHLVDTGLAWTLQGYYGRMAAALIEDEFITPTA